MTTRVAPLRHKAVSRMDSAERLSVTGIVSGPHHHDDNSWFVLVVTHCVTTLRHAHRHTTSMMSQLVFHDVLSNFEDGRCHAFSSVDANDRRCLDGFQQ